MLLPRELDMIEAGKHMPLPLPKPNFAEVEVRKHNERSIADLAKSEVNARVAAAYARVATGNRVDGKPSVPHSAPAVVPVTKRVKSTSVSVLNYSGNSSIIRLRARSVRVGWGSPSRR